MLEGLNTAAAGMAAQQTRIDAVANDLANANTTGYKHLRVGFRDLVYTQTGRSSAQGPRTGAGAAAVDAGRAFDQGALQRTDQPLDVAIQGEGFLRVRLADGTTALTRDGSLHVDGTGRLVTSTGAFVQPAMSIPAGTALSSVTVGPDGAVVAGGRSLGKLDLVSVRSPQALQPLGDNVFAATAASGAPRPAPAATTIAQGALEASNTDVSDAMVTMIESQRAYQLTSKAIQTADQMWEIANGVKR
jgi:flagellar basal-body rod protein FlgG